ncbi:Aldehyde dehydrogenase domain [Fusarium oxysporum f. sp. vasinfectum]|nr:Aldehyde dehydrogenase domain [Fusarium oxysporum f. sp. vasinfectum]
MAANTNSQLRFTEFYNIIDGKLETTRETVHGINPSTLEKLAPLPLSTPEDVDRAVRAARKASEVWAGVPYRERQNIIAKFADGIEAIGESLAPLLVKEQGKSLAMAQMEVGMCANFLRGYAKLPEPEDVIEDKPGRRVITKYVPIGVAVGIVPWNVPVFLAGVKLGPALVAGNAVILKPSPFTPYCNLKIVELAQQYSPQASFKHSMISFTGSTATGKKVMQSAAATLKRVTLELGGNDPAIICGDVDIKAVAPKIAFSSLVNSGQVCIASKRIYVHESIYDEFLKELVTAVEQHSVGDGLDSNVVLGPVQNHLQFARVKDLLADIQANNLKLATGSTEASNAGKGYFITPTVVDNPPDDSRIVVEEPFGPVFPVLKWKDEEEVLRRANDTDMGLGSSVWTKEGFGEGGEILYEAQRWNSLDQQQP